MLYFEYVSTYRRITLSKENTTWVLKVEFLNSAEHIPSFEKTYGDYADAYAWAKSYVENREILMNILTVREAVGKVLVDKPFPDRKYITLQRLKALEESVSFLSNYIPDKNFTEVVGSGINNEDIDCPATGLLKRLGEINLERASLIQCLKNRQ